MSLTRRQQACLAAIATHCGDEVVTSHLYRTLLKQGYVEHVHGQGPRVTSAGYAAVRECNRDVYASYDQRRMYFWLLRYGDVLTRAAK